VARILQLAYFTLQGSDGTVIVQTYQTRSTSTFFDFLGLTPNVEYSLGLQIQTDGGMAHETGIALAVSTRKLFLEFNRRAFPVQFWSCSSCVSNLASSNN